MKLKNKTVKVLIITMIMMVVLLSGCSNDYNSSNANGIKDNSIENTLNNKSNSNTEKNSYIKNNGNLKVCYIDVGQADSILIQQGSHNMLIDAGNNDDSDLVVKYLKNNGVKKLDYVIGTHPHEDHIGGLDEVIKNFDIGMLYMPKVSNTTKTFKDVLIAAQGKNLKITEPKVNSTFKLGNANCTILAPNATKYDDLNNYSIVTKIKFGNNSFLFTGDAEGISERQIASKQLDIKADVLKVGHHGSHSSTTDDFLTKVNPKYAVIMCGKYNDYGHPHKETLIKLSNKNVEVYRTDEVGTITAISDGNTISFDKNQSDNKLTNNIKKNTEEKKVLSSNSKYVDESLNKNIVYVTKAGKKYHKIGCEYLNNSSYKIGLQEAKTKGYTPCSKCN